MLKEEKNMAEEYEIEEGVELTEEEKANGVTAVTLEPTELTEEELEATAGGASGKITIGARRKLYCPWCGCYEDVGDCGRASGKFGKMQLTNMPLLWCYRVRKYFLGPGRSGKYYSWQGIVIR